MKNIIYFFQFIFIMLLFLIFKILKLKISSALGGKLFQIIGPIFRSNKLIRENIIKALPKLNDKEIKKIVKNHSLGYRDYSSKIWTILVLEEWLINNDYELDFN